MAITYLQAGILVYQLSCFVTGVTLCLTPEKRDSGTVQFGSPLERGRGVFLEQCIIVRHGVETHPTTAQSYAPPLKRGTLLSTVSLVLFLQSKPTGQ